MLARRGLAAPTSCLTMMPDMRRSPLSTAPLSIQWWSYTTYYLIFVPVLFSDTSLTLNCIGGYDRKFHAFPT